MAGAAVVTLAAVFAGTILVVQLELAGAFDGSRVVVAPDIVEPPPDRTPTTIATSCGAYKAIVQQTRVLSVDTRAQLQVAVGLSVNTEDAILRSAGAVKERSILDGDRPLQLLADGALGHLCSGTPATTPP